MRSMLGRDAVFLLIDHRIDSLVMKRDLPDARSDRMDAQIEVLQNLKTQLDHIIPVPRTHIG